MDTSLWASSLAVLFGMMHLLPRPTENATSATTNAIGGGYTAIKTGRAEAMVFALFAVANNMLDLMG